MDEATPASNALLIEDNEALVKKILDQSKLHFETFTAHHAAIKEVSLWNYYPASAKLEQYRAARRLR